MFIPFEDLPKSSKIWIYQSERKLSDEEVQIADEILKNFIETWAAHSTPLEASYEIKYNRFIVLAVNHLVDTPH